MATDAQAPVVLTQEKLRDRLPAMGAELVALDERWPQIERESDGPLPSAAEAEDLAYVIYTSGSTGQPKGAMNAHRGIVNRLLWMQQQYKLTATDVVLQKTPFSFDVSVWEFFWPLLVGARLELARPGGHQDPGYLVELIEAAGVTVVHFVPSMLQVFLEEPGLAERCRSLRHVVCSGEALTADLRDRFYERMGRGVSLHNLYGPTEAAVDVTHWTCERGTAERVVPIGRPVANTQVYVLDEALAPVPVGVAGELFLGGVQVGRGYWRRPELTAERFISDPFSATVGARLYRTGDLARWRSDGALEFLGRLDHQVKVRGLRIELGEIETVLEAQPEVRQAVVLAKEQQASGEKRLVAYLVPRDAGRFDAGPVRERLLAAMPDYMVPWRFIVLEAMPLTPSGKVDRKALPDPGTERPDLGPSYVAARDALEQLIVSEWQSGLGLDRVGVHDRFFELGGSSLDAARFVNRMQQELGEFIYITTIFEAPTPAEYASLLRRDYPSAVARRFGTAEPVAADSARPSGSVDEAGVERLQAAVPRLGRAPVERTGSQNPRAMFVLSPPRSGTTLLRVMLAGHPELFAAAELQLLGFHTLADRRAAYTGKFALWREGTVRALMELRGIGPDEAKQVMAEFERAGMSTREFYGVLQAETGGRMLVDKSPSYALDPDALAKAEADFAEPLYIHLTRHPYAVVRSFESYHMHQVLYLDPHPFAPQELGELVWTLSHRNVLAFLKDVPPERQFRLSFEHMVREPVETMQALCRTLGLRYHESLVAPYQDVERKMTDGLYRESTPMGDTRFLERKRIDPAVAESWRGVLTDDFLGDVTWRIAEMLGYERPVSVGAEPVGEGEADRAARRRREFLDQSRRRRARGRDT
jgi:amino acid adenylation domain-containing protein